MSVMQFGLGLGLAGAAGIRTYFPLLVMALLTRFAGTVAFRPPFGVFGSIPVLLILAVLAAFEIMVEGSPGFNRTNQVMLSAGLRALGGAIVFAGTFGGFGTLAGLILGALLAVMSYLITVRLRPQLTGTAKGILPTGTEETAAIAGTLLAVLLPWTSYFIWGVILFMFIRKMKTQNTRYRPEGKARSWR